MSLNKGLFSRFLFCKSHRPNRFFFLNKDLRSKQGSVHSSTDVLLVLKAFCLSDFDKKKVNKQMLGVIWSHVFSCGECDNLIGFILSNSSLFGNHKIKIKNRM